jgi:hypothetical protein
MLRVELLGAALTLSILWLMTISYAVIFRPQPPTGIVILVFTVATGAAWAVLWGRRVNAQLTAARNEMAQMRNEVEELRVEKDVELAMQKLRPHLRVVHHDK